MGFTLAPPTKSELQRALYIIHENAKLEDAVRRAENTQLSTRRQSLSENSLETL